MSQPVWKERLAELLEEYKDRFNWCPEDNDELIDLLLTERSDLLDKLAESRSETDRLHKWCLMLTPDPVKQERVTQIKAVVTELLEDFKSEKRGGHEADYNHHFYRLRRLMEEQT